MLPTVALGMLFFWNIYLKCYNLLNKNTYCGSVQVMMMPEERKFVRGKLFQLKILNPDKTSLTMHNGKNFALD